MHSLKSKIIEWLESRDESDIVYVKKHYQSTIFGKHIGITHHDVLKLLAEPRKKIMKVIRSTSHEDRLMIVREFSRNYDTAYIILDPFNTNLEAQFKDKVGIVTVYPVKRRLKSPDAR